MARPSGGWIAGYQSYSTTSTFSRSNGVGVWSISGFTNPPIPIQLAATMWLDASTSSTLYNATSGGSLVASGGTVRRWEDRTGNGNHVTGSTGPTRSLASVNGLDSLAFSSQYMENSSLGLSAATAASLFAVIKFASSGTQIAAGFGTSSSYAAMTIEANVRTNGLHSAAFGSLSTASEVYATGGAVSASTRSYGAVYGSSVGTLYINGSSAATVSRTQAISSGSGFTVGGYFGLGGYYLSGNVCEVCFFRRALNSNDISRLQNYFQSKWGV